MTAILWRRGGWLALMVACGVLLTLTLCISAGRLMFGRRWAKVGCRAPGSQLSA